jgi:hypothetical protein
MEQFCMEETGLSMNDYFAREQAQEEAFRAEPKQQSLSTACDIQIYDSRWSEGLKLDRNMFWGIIDSVNVGGAYPDQEIQRCRLTAALEKHTMEELLDWQLILEEYMQSACRQDILAAAAARGVPCLEDGFSQFRAWLIAGGEEVYRNILQEPDCLADLPGNGDAFQFKELTLAAYYAYEIQLFLACPGELRDLYSDLRGPGCRNPGRHPLWTAAEGGHRRRLG